MDSELYFSGLLHEQISEVAGDRAGKADKSLAEERRTVQQESPWGKTEITLIYDALGRLAVRKTVEKTRVQLSLQTEQLVENPTQLEDSWRETKFVYDGDTDRVSQLVESGIMRGAVVSTRTVDFGYSEEGKLRKKDINWVDFKGLSFASYSEEAVEYDNEGRPSKIKILDGRKDVDHPQEITRTRTYNERGQVVTEEDVDLTDAKIVSSFEVQYDTEGRIFRVNKERRGERMESTYRYSSPEEGVYVVERKVSSFVPGSDERLDQGGERLITKNDQQVGYQSWASEADLHVVNTNWSS